MKKTMLFVLIGVLVFGACTFAFAESGDFSEQREELKEISQTIKDQMKVIKEKEQTVIELRNEAGKNKDWEAIKTFREYRRTHIEFRIERMNLRMERLDAYDVIDEARQNQDKDLLKEGLDVLIENGLSVIELNENIIENLDECIAALQ